MPVPAVKSLSVFHHSAVFILFTLGSLSPFCYIGKSSSAKAYMLGTITTLQITLLWYEGLNQSTDSAGGSIVSGDLRPFHLTFNFL